MELVKREGSLIKDSIIMFIRTWKLAFRSPEAVMMATVVPAALMAMFVYVFGRVMDVGDVSVVNFIVPGVLLQAIGQSIPATAVGINNDLRKGVIDRFRTMPITRHSVLIGHVVAALFRTLIAVTLTIGVAFLVGFRPYAGFTDWLMIAGILALYINTLAWFALISGVRASDPESAGGMMQLLGALPFLSSGFVPTEALPRGLRIFAENQPMTPVIDTMRALMLGHPIPDGALRAAFIWCVGLTALFYIIATRVYARKVSR